ncbi:MAG TPA: hypothetical protein VKW04_03290 [Planctomycetota bacterium]|nr:hypothetical protein [Planctomycetota bacterium]
MSDAADAPRPSRIPPWFQAALAVLTLLFLGAGLRRANGGTLRGDEVVSHFSNARKQSPGDLLLRGARPQVSPAPLLYLVDQAMNSAKGPFRYLGLTPSGYIRLPSLIFTALLGVAAALVVARHVRREGERPSPVPYLLVLCGLAAYWFHPKVFPFACTERPYALWNGLWVFFLAWILVRPSRSWIPTTVLCLMAATAVSACFQLLGVGIALLAVRRLEVRPWKDVFREAGGLLGPAAVIGIYYALQTQSFDFDERPYGEAATDFVRFWLVTQLPAWIAVGIACGLAFWRPPLRVHALPSGSLAVMLLLMPLIFTAAHSRGYSSPSRQYIWSTAAIPLALWLGAVAWPQLRERRYSAPLSVLLGVGLAAGFAIAAMLRPPARNDSVALTCLRPGSPLILLLRKERPRWLACPASTPAIEVQNVELLAEWIGIRYAGLPAGDRTVTVRKEHGELLADPVDGPPERGAEWILISIKP